MQVELTGWDWAVGVAALAATAGVGLAFTRRASRGLEEYFVSGRKLPWWALGTSMVATTFASDTPLVVSGLVIERGIAGNWLWWNFLFGATLTVFVFSRWWRRAGLVTEIEFIARRYDGRPAAFLRGFKALYLGLLVNSIVFAWVTKAMAQIVEVYFGLPAGLSVAVLLALTLTYTLAAGLWGVVASDLLQFVMALGGAVVLAVLSVSEAGGLAPLVERVQALEEKHGRDLLAFAPGLSSAFGIAAAILVLVNWWAVYYPGAEPGGGGYIAQRMLAARDERHARAGTLWFTIAHYVLRPWPWILVALSAVVLEERFLEPARFGSDFAPEKAYPFMFHVLPPGLRGFVLASLAAAFMSTQTTMLNLSASYLVNDFYLPLASKRAVKTAPVWVARAAVLLVAVSGSLASILLLRSAGQGWQLIMELTAGTGLVLILRWLWWRVNAWSEISAMLASACACLAAYVWGGPVFEKAALALAGESPPALVSALRLVAIVAASTAVWVAVTFSSRPVGEERLADFFRTVRPGGFWGPVARAASLAPAPLGRDLAAWALSSAVVLGLLFGTGGALLLDAATALPAFLAAAAAGIPLAVLIHRERER